MATPTPSSSRRRAAVGLAVACAIVLGCVGAVLAFIRHVKYSYVVGEPSHNLKVIFRGAAAFHEGLPEDGAPIAPGQLPPAGPLTPSTVPCASREPWPTPGHPTWSAIGFAPGDGTRFSYEWEPHQDGTFVIRAHADLDCDGEFSTFQLRGGVNEAGQLYREPNVTETDPLE